MTDRFLEVCEREFAAHVKLLFDNALRIPGNRDGRNSCHRGGVPAGHAGARLSCMSGSAWPWVPARSSARISQPGLQSCHCTRDAIAAMKDDDMPGDCRRGALC